MLTVLFGASALFAFFEALYLGDQAREFSSERIRAWMRVFQLLTVLFAGCLAAMILE